MSNFVFRQRGILHPTINQYDIVILIRFDGKVAIAAFGASFFSCDCPGDNRDFLVRSKIFS